MRKQLDLIKIRALLEEQHKVLQDRIKEQVGSEPKTINPDRSDLAWQYIQGQREALLSTRAEQQLVEVETALARLQEGVYGKCTQCGRDIHPARLESIPTTSMCFQCKAAE